MSKLARVCLLYGALLIVWSAYTFPVHAAAQPWQVAAAEEYNVDDNGEGAYGRAGIPRRGAGPDGVVGTADDAGPIDLGRERTSARHWGPGVINTYDRDDDATPRYRDLDAGASQIRRAANVPGPDTSNYDWLGWFGLLGLLGLFNRNRTTSK